MLTTRFMLRARPSFVLRTFSSTSEKGYCDDRSELNITQHPEIPQKKPYKVLLTKGETYYWCTCGKSKAQPFCDGNHKDTCFKPLKFTYTEETKERGLCGCKLNNESKGPFCDSTHKYVEFDSVSQQPPGFFRDPKWRESIGTPKK